MKGGSTASPRRKAAASNDATSRAQRTQHSTPLLHPQAMCESKTVGPRTRVWAFAHILPGARIGADCNICDHTFIENDVRLGDRVTVKCGVQLWDGVVVEDDVFIGPNATFANDIFPRSRQRPAKFLATIVKAGASIGANATILPGITIGRGAMVGAGAVVVESVPPYAVVAGNPARVQTGCYLVHEPRPLRSAHRRSEHGRSESQLHVEGATLTEHRESVPQLPDT